MSFFCYWRKLAGFGEVSAGLSLLSVPTISNWAHFITAPTINNKIFFMTNTFRKFIWHLIKTFGNNNSFPTARVSRQQNASKQSRTTLPEELGTGTNSQFTSYSDIERRFGLTRWNRPSLGKIWTCINKVWRCVK